MGRRIEKRRLQQIRRLNYRDSVDLTGDSDPASVLGISSAIRVVGHDGFYEDMRPLTHSDRIRKIDVAFNEFEQFLQQEVASKSKELDENSTQNITASNRNLFTRIVMASKDEKRFSERDIIGNLFIYLFAGVRGTLPSRPT